eukprot:COSAG03_NODE_1392_length_4178_cov_3.543516_3_plen_87_part_01
MWRNCSGARVCYKVRKHAAPTSGILRQAVLFQETSVEQAKVGQSNTQGPSFRRHISQTIMERGGPDTSSDCCGGIMLLLWIALTFGG